MRARRPARAWARASFLRRFGQGNIYEHLSVAAIALALALVYAHGVFRNLTYWGISDWDSILAFHEVPRRTVLEFGQVSLWNPWGRGGQEMLGNTQSRFLSPTFLFVLWFGTVIGAKLDLVFHLALGLMGAYYLGRRAELERPAAWLVAATFLLGGMYAQSLKWGMIWFSAIGYLPWALLGVLVGGRRGYLIGGTALAFMVFTGGPYVLSISALFLVLFCSCDAVVRRSRASVETLAKMALFAIGLSAIKLIPAVGVLRDYPRYIEDYSGYSLSGLAVSLVDRMQNLRFPDYGDETGLWQGMSWGPDENLSYIGFVPVLLAFAGAFRRSRLRTPLVACLIIFVYLGLGDRAEPLSLWQALHKLPVYASMRVAQRFRIAFIPCIALLAGLGLQGLSAWGGRRFARAGLVRAITLGAVAGIVADLLWVNAPLLGEAFVIPPVTVQSSAEYYQVTERGPEHATGPELARWCLPTVSANVGIIGCGDSSRVANHALGADNPDYRGEVFIAGTEGTARFVHWTPNRVTVAVRATGEGLLVLNQNLYFGWRARRADGSSPPVVDAARADPRFRGQVAVPITPADTTIELSYAPLAFTWGLVVTLGTLFVPFAGRRLEGRITPRALLVSALVLCTAAAVIYGWSRATYGERPVYIHVRWTESTSRHDREQREERYRLTRGVPNEGATWDYYLTDTSTSNIRALVEDKLVEDTHYVDRARFRIAPTATRADYDEVPWLLNLLVLALGAAGGVSAVLGAFAGRSTEAFTRNASAAESPS